LLHMFHPHSQTLPRVVVVAHMHLVMSQLFRRDK
jgi:hypothetical protein